MEEQQRLCRARLPLSGRERGDASSTLKRLVSHEKNFAFFCSQRLFLFLSCSVFSFPSSSTRACRAREKRESEAATRDCFFFPFFFLSTSKPRTHPLPPPPPPPGSTPTTQPPPPPPPSLSPQQTAAAPKKVLTAGKDIKATQFTIGLSSKKGKTVAIGFTKSNELFVGRMAMIGIASSIIGEVLTGKGALAQLGFETGLPIFDLDGLILAVIGFNLVAALLPAKGKFIPDEEELTERPAGALQSSKVSLATPGAFFGIKGFGFTKENELFVGRMAQLGFAASLIGEGITGKGFLGQLGFETGIPLIDIDFFLAVSIAFTLFAAINEGSGKFVDEE